MRILLPALFGYAMDLALGDPGWLTPYHPVVLIAREAGILRKYLRRWFPATPMGEQIAGCCLAVLVPASVYSLSSAALRLIRGISPVSAFALETVWSWECIAAKNLKDVAMRVQEELETGSLGSSQFFVSRLVSRDVENLSREGVARAAVESVAENFSDGVGVPLFYLFLGGAPLALTYKAINTLDSLVGYRTPRYLHFGRASAKLDDAVNYLPSRLSALAMISASGLIGLDQENALRIWKRDRRNHPSPNSGQCEAAAAGALHIRLCGPTSYFGTVEEKPYIGDDDRPIQPEDIKRICRLEYAASVISLIALSVFRIGLKGIQYGMGARWRLDRLSTKIRKISN